MIVKLDFDRKTKLRTFTISELTAIELAVIRTAIYSLRETKNLTAPYDPTDDEVETCRKFFPKLKEAAELARKRT